MVTKKAGSKDSLLKERQTRPDSAFKASRVIQERCSSYHVPTCVLQKKPGGTRVRPAVVMCPTHFLRAHSPKIAKATRQCVT